MPRHDPEPRLLTQSQAAAYCGVCAEVFKKACPVKPVNLLDRIPRYDRRALDRWIDSLDNIRPIDEADDLAGMWNAGQHDARTGH
jgi:hypothetical protein